MKKKDYSKRPLSLIILFALTCICSCSLQTMDKHNTFVLCTLDEFKIVVDVDTFSTYKYYLNIGSVIVDSGIVSEHKEFVLSEVVKSTGTNTKEIALSAAKNAFTHEIRLLINNTFDTTFTYRQTITEIPDDDISFTGFGAPLVKVSKKDNVEKELRVWLYRKQEHISDSLFDALRLIYSEITSTGDNEYIPKGEIPVVHNIDGHKYKVNCDVQADYYAVVACHNQAYINQFIEQAVGNNFAGISTTLSAPLICNYKKGTTGYRNVFLLCINKDWTYKQIPLATFVLDNSAPESHFYDASSRLYQGRYYYKNEESYSVKEPNSLRYDNRIKVLYPKNKPKIFGEALVIITNWDGNGLECNATFRVELNGDTKSATIQRRGDLCCYDKYLGYHLKPEDKVIYAKDHSGPYTFTYKLHFDDGDNIIPIVVEDYHGNKHKGSITVNARFERSNSPQINIDNNIDIYN